MNNLLKLMAFVCLILMVNTANAQASRSATVSADGLIVLDASLPDVAAEYVANISRFSFSSYQEASNYFQKYVSASAGRGMSFFFDIPNQKLFIYVDVANQNMVPKSHAKAVSVSDINYFLKAVHEGRIN